MLRGKWAWQLHRKLHRCVMWAEGKLYRRGQRFLVSLYAHLIVFWSVRVFYQIIGGIGEKIYIYLHLINIKIPAIRDKAAEWLAKKEEAEKWEKVLVVLWKSTRFAKAIGRRYFAIKKSFTIKFKKEKPVFQQNTNGKLLGWFSLILYNETFGKQLSTSQWEEIFKRAHEQKSKRGFDHWINIYCQFQNIEAPDYHVQLFFVPGFFDLNNILERIMFSDLHQYNFIRIISILENWHQSHIIHIFYNINLNKEEDRRFLRRHQYRYYWRDLYARENQYDFYFEAICELECADIARANIATIDKWKLTNKDLHYFDFSIKPRIVFGSTLAVCTRLRLFEEGGIFEHALTPQQKEYIVDGMFEVIEDRLVLTKRFDDDDAIYDKTLDGTNFTYTQFNFLKHEIDDLDSPDYEKPWFRKKTFTFRWYFLRIVLHIFHFEKTFENDPEVEGFKKHCAIVKLFVKKLTDENRVFVTSKDPHDNKYLYDPKNFHSDFNKIYYGAKSKKNNVKDE